MNRFQVFIQPEAVFRERATTVAFQQIARIRQLIPTADIEHIGGTSVTGAITKGDVDLVMQIGAEGFDAAVKALREIYAVNQPENWTPTFASFKDDTSFELPFGTQLVVKDSDCYSFTQLRDRLNSDPAALAGYNAMKRAHQGADATMYREAKGKFIEQLLAGASTK